MMTGWQRMYAQEPQASQGPGGYIYGTVCHVNLINKLSDVMRSSVNIFPDNMKLFQALRTMEQQD